MYEQLDLFSLDKQLFCIDKPIRLLEMFAGIGATAMALRDLGADFEHYRAVEFDKFAMASYNAIHGTDFKPTDIRDIKGEDLGICDCDKYTHILTYSFPCFTGDTLVLTANGYKTIDSITKEDYVLTHSNEYKRVIDSRCTGIKNIYSVKGMGIDGIKCTENHKLYVRKMVKHYPTHENGKRYREREFLNPEWIECKNLTKECYLGVAINQNSIIPSWGGIDFEWSDGRKTRSKNQLSALMENHSFWWIIGRYVGDGWQRTQGGIVVSNNKTRTHDMFPHLRNCGFSYSEIEERTATNIHIVLKELQEFVKPFGKGAINKEIPGFVIDLPIPLIKSFLDGYMSADGYYVDGLYKASSISKKLIYGIAQLVAKAYKTPYRIYKTKRKKTCVIEGRTVNQNDTYEVVWKMQKKKQDKAFYRDGYVWFPIREIVNMNETERVYDITVEDSHSFTANGVIVHNCQDLSVAGKQAGMSEDSGSRSSLLWQVKRLLNECAELPQVLILENVSQIHGKKFMPDFQKWLDFLESKGYSNYWQDLNAKDYGVAQNRLRTFCVSLLGNYTYKFPEPIPLTKTMKDYLEDEVSEKYYINTEKAQKLIQKLIENGTLDGTRQTCHSNGEDVSKFADVAKTISARDYKGFSSSFQEMNAVIEKIPCDLSVNEPRGGVIVANCITARQDRGISNQRQVGNGGG